MFLHNPCPHSALLRELLESTLPEDQQAKLTEHLGDCAICQQALEELAISDVPWSQVARRINRPQPAPDSALQRAIKGLKDRVSLTGSEQEAMADDEISLSFLHPSDKPGCLGCLGAYEVTETIGRGGMGVVLKALDPSLNRYVAIKVLAPQLATSAAARKRFAREARAAAAVSHEHVVAIHNVGEVDGLPYLVMEYVPGLSLQQRLDRTGPLELKEILRIGMQTASGLAAAHAQGVIHRDMKPANILLENGVERVKITDFGLARTVDDATLTQSGVLAGTPQYMAPEQARGEAQDHRADLFSLGSVLYTLCAGRPPFRANTTMAVLRRVSDGAPRFVRDVNPETPDWLAEIIEKLHAKNPGDRFQSAAEVAELLSQHLAQLQQLTATPLPRLAKVGEPKRGQQVTPHSSPTLPLPRSLPFSRKWAVAAAVVLCLFGGLGVTEATGRTAFTNFVATVLRIRTPGGILRVEVDDPEVKVSVDTDGKELVITGAGVHEIRLRPGQHQVTATKDGAVIMDELVTITKNGKKVVTVSREPSDQAKTAQQDQPQHTQEPAAAVEVIREEAKTRAATDRALRFLELQLRTKEHQELPLLLAQVERRPQPGPLLLAQVERHPQQAAARLQQPAAFQIQAELHVPTKRLWSLAFSPDGKTLASGSGFWDSPSAVTLWDVASGKVRVTAKEEMPVRSVAFSADGKLLATGEFDKTAKLRDAATCRVQITLQGHEHLVNSVAFSPDGRILASSDLGNTINLWEVSTGNLRITLQGHTDEVPKVAFSPDGRTLVSGSKDRTARLWDVATGRELRILQGHHDLVECVAFSPDGKLVATGSWDKTVKLWDAATGKEVRVFRGHSLPVLSLAFSPDGKVLATASGEWGDPNISPDTPGPGEVKLWDLATGKELATLRDHKDRIWTVTFSPDGKTLATGSWDGVIILWKTAALKIHPAPQDYEQRLRQLQDEIDRLKKEIERLRAKPRSGAREDLRGSTTPRESQAGLTSAILSADGNMAIALMNADGSDASSLTDSRSINGDPTWSPDGSKLAFTSSRGSARDGESDIYVMDADGSDLKQLTRENGINRGPAWSPDGRKIAFTSYRDGNNEIYVMDADGSNQINLTNDPGYDADPAWSPDGKKIAFASRRDGNEGFHLYVMDVDGKNVRDISHIDNNYGHVYPAWSPDGKKIAYAEPTENALEIFLCDAGGSNKNQLSNLGGHNSRPAWSPDGKKIAFIHTGNVADSIQAVGASPANTMASLYVMDADGSNPKAVLKEKVPVEGGRPAWKPK